jgi:hypothetical protein
VLDTPLLYIVIINICARVGVPSFMLALHLSLFPSEHADGLCFIVRVMVTYPSLFVAQGTPIDGCDKVMHRPHNTHLLVRRADLLFCSVCGNWGQHFYHNLFHRFSGLPTTRFHKMTLIRLRRNLPPLVVANISRAVLEIVP